jgi:hypothetical protein
LQYENRYVKGIKLPPNSNLVLGSSVHGGIEVNYNEKLKTKKAANRNVVMDAYSQAFEEMKHGAEFAGVNEGMIKDRGYAMSELHYTDVAPNVQPLEKPEFYFEMSIEGVKKKIIGYIDVIAKTRFSPRAVLDNKTSGRKKDQMEADLDSQLTIYQKAHIALFKKKASLGFDVLVGKKAGVEYQRVTTSRNDTQLKQMDSTIRMIDAAINAGIFYPCDNQQTCSWCGYAGQCPSASVAVAARDAIRNADRKD